jgi:hypothetical protein
MDEVCSPDRCSIQAGALAVKVLLLVNFLLFANLGRRYCTSHNR